MRILLLTASYAPVLGGLQNVVRALAIRLQTRGEEVEIITNRYPRDLPALQVIDGVRVHRWLFPGAPSPDLIRRRPDLSAAGLLYRPLSMLRLRRFIKAFRPELVNIHFPDRQSTYLLGVRQRQSFKLVVSLHGDEIERWTGGRLPGAKSTDPETQPREALLELRRLLREADAVTACSQYLLDEALQLEPQLAARRSVIHNGIDGSAFALSEAFQHPRPYLFAWGRLTQKKGFDLLIEAFSRLASSFPNLDLLIAGSGELQGALQRKIDGAGMQDRIALIGRQDAQDVVRLLNGCLLAVVPSRREPFGLVALEALAAGKPVLATRVGGLGEVISDRNGWLVDPDASSLAAGLRQAVPQVAGGRRPISLEEVQQLQAAWSWERVVDRYQGVFASCR